MNLVPLFIEETIKPKGHKIITFFRFLRRRVDHFFSSYSLRFSFFFSDRKHYTNWWGHWRWSNLDHFVSSAAFELHVQNAINIKTIDRASAAKRWRFVLSLLNFIFFSLFYANVDRSYARPTFATYIPIWLAKLKKNRMQKWKEKEKKREREETRTSSLWFEPYYLLAHCQKL